MRFAGQDGRRGCSCTCHHTTAGVTINEHADPAVARDFETALERIVPADWSWQHIEEGEENAPTHIRAAFMGPSVVIPLRDDGALALGTWQGVFFFEFDGPRERSVYRHRPGVTLPTVPRHSRHAATLRQSWPPLSATGEELELHVDSLAYGGNGVARLNGFVVFVRRGLPGDTVRAQVTKVKRGFAEATALEVLSPGPNRGRGALPALWRLRRLQVPGLRLRVPARGQGGAGPRRADATRSHRRPSRGVESFRPNRSFGYRNKLEYSFTQTEDGPALGFHRAGRWDECSRSTSAC